MEKNEKEKARNGNNESTHTELLASIEKRTKGNKRNPSGVALESSASQFENRRSDRRRMR
jgi:hypothetical protein